MRSPAPGLDNPTRTRGRLAPAHRDERAPSASEARGFEEGFTPACVGAASEPRLRYPSRNTTPRGAPRRGRRRRRLACLRGPVDEAEYLCRSLLGFEGFD